MERAVGSSCKNSARKVNQFYGELFAVVNPAKRPFASKLDEDDLVVSTSVQRENERFQCIRKGKGF